MRPPQIAGEKEGAEGGDGGADGASMRPPQIAGEKLEARLQIRHALAPASMRPPQIAGEKSNRVSRFVRALLRLQ